MKVEQSLKECLANIKADDKGIRAFLEVRPEKELEAEARALDKKKKKGKLHGKVIAVKSNINVKGMKVSCASRTLEDYKGSYDATVVKNIRAEDGLIIGMTNMDEFAAGSTGESSAFGVTDNPKARGHVPGGSSSGSAAAVAAGMCDIALGSDTGGSIRVPASFCGVVGVKPSYGSVSRYGLIDLSMSLDQIGPLSRNVEDAALLLEVIKGKDEKDTQSNGAEQVFPLKKSKSVTIGLASIQGLTAEVGRHFKGFVEKLKKELDWKSKTVRLAHIDLGIQTYHLLCWTEFFSATRRFDGRKYGKKIEEVAGPEVLRRIFGGSAIAKAEYAGRYYYKALRVKEVIRREFEKALEKVDCIIMPTTPMLPWKLGEKVMPEELYATDALAIPANLAGVCSVSVPSGTIDGKPIGIQVICGKGWEGRMLSIAREIENLR